MNALLEVESLTYQLAQKTVTQHLCGPLCSRTVYSSILNFYSENVLSKEIHTFGDGYFVVWAYYSSLYVTEKKETYIFDFDSALVAVGGSLGLFLGWSCYSMIVDLIEFIYYRQKRH